jgi:hypothetical protein
MKTELAKRHKQLERVQLKWFLAESELKMKIVKNLAGVNF